MGGVTPFPMGILEFCCPRWQLPRMRTGLIGPRPVSQHKAVELEILP